MLLFTHEEYASANDVLFSVLVSQHGTDPESTTWRRLGHLWDDINRTVTMDITFHTGFPRAHCNIVPLQSG